MKIKSPPTKFQILVPFTLEIQCETEKGGCGATYELFTDDIYNIEARNGNQLVRYTCYWCPHCKLSKPIDLSLLPDYIQWQTRADWMKKSRKSVMKELFQLSGLHIVLEAAEDADIPEAVVVSFLEEALA